MPRTIRRLLGLPERAVEHGLRRYEDAAALVRRQREGLRDESEDQLAARSASLRARAAAPSDPSDLAVEAFALAAEACARVVSMDPFDVQVIGALVMQDGRIAEMQTGEGKTLAAVLPVYLNALARGGVHVLTANDYLADRDSRWMGPVYAFLGMSVGCVREGMDADARRRAYACDVTYATADEVGFDYLRDGLCTDVRDVVHRPFRFALLDEIDSILIDEARNPLVVAGGDAPPDPWTRIADDAVSTLAPQDYEVDVDSGQVRFTERGLDRLEAALGVGRLHDEANVPLFISLTYALRAHVVLEADADYIVRGGRIEIVDAFKGRVAERRRWPDGLQAAVETKEGLAPTRETAILSLIALQDFVRLYPRICGMTGTAVTSAEEFRDVYGLTVVVVPPNRPCRRADLPDVVFTHREAKEHHLVQEIARERASGRPVLVGTATVGESERIAARLRDAGVECTVLNAKNDAEEARIVAGAGAPAAVTISTNMAGRGVDIRLGGADQREHARVEQLGGLYVIGTNRHDARRIDRQLRGRAGRQGDPGESRFFVSLTDDLIVRYGIDDLLSDDDWRPEHRTEPLDDPWVAARIERAQRAVDWVNSRIRVNTMRYTAVLEEQRRAVRKWRDEVLSRTRASFLAERDHQRYHALERSAGADVLAEAERQVTLFHIDDAWSRHLQEIRELRELLAPTNGPGQAPVGVFRQRAAQAFVKMVESIERRVLDSLAASTVTREGIDLEAEGLVRPTATWTYQLSDTPLRSELYGPAELVKSMLRDAFRKG